MFVLQSLLLQWHAFGYLWVFVVAYTILALVVVNCRNLRSS